MELQHLSIYLKYKDHGGISEYIPVPGSSVQGQICINNASHLKSGTPASDHFEGFSNGDAGSVALRFGEFNDLFQTHLTQSDI